MKATWMWSAERVSKNCTVVCWIPRVILTPIGTPRNKVLPAKRTVAPTRVRRRCRVLRSDLPAIHATTDERLFSKAPEYCGAVENSGSGREQDATARQRLAASRSLSAVARKASPSS